MTESVLLKKIWLEASKKNYTLFRNNVGSATTNTGQFIRFGLCKGSSDLIGFKKITITPEMVGKEIAQFCALEIKHNAGVSKEQMNFILFIKNNGGIGEIVRSVEEI